MRLGGVRTREDPTRPKEPDPHSQWTERGSEKGEGDLDELERGTGLWGERGVLRLGMVSEGGEYGSKFPLTIQDMGGRGRG